MDKQAINYRIRTPQFPNLYAAGKLCTKILAAGHTNCLVIFHNSRVWAAVDQPNLSPITHVTRVSKGAKQGAYRLQLASYRTERGAAKGQAKLKKAGW